VRDYRLEVGSKAADGNFRSVCVRRFLALDAREARARADIWLAGMTPSLDASLQVKLFLGASAVCSRPSDGRIWETLA
jgi:hypothetical protein